MHLKNRLRRRLKILFDRIESDKFKDGLLQALPFWMASLVTGLIAVAYSKIFSLAEKGTHLIFSRSPLLFFIITPACFILSWWVVKRFSTYARGSGIPQVMAAIELSTPNTDRQLKSLLGIKIILIKISSSIIMVFGGGAIGREGPTIQIAGSVFYQINQWLPAWWPKVSKKNMIMTGAAAGLAAAFNTPLGGIVFAVEELTKTHMNYFKTALFSAVIIAGLTAQGFLGPYLYLGYPDVRNLSKYVIIPVIGVAVLTGLSGGILSKAMLKILKWKKTFKSSYKHLAYLFISAIILAGLAVFIDIKTFGSGKDFIANILFTHQKYTSWDVSLLRMFGPLISFTSGAAGGIFAPALCAGAGLGSMVSGWFHMTDTNTNLIVLSGMVGFLTGVTRTPFTSSILVLEMTDRHNVIFFLILAGMIASLAAYIVDRHSLYDHLREEYMSDLRKEKTLESESKDRIRNEPVLKSNPS
jgi:H+/Cl- antiporter ClcA